MASTYLQRSTTTRTNNQAYTFSCWFKRSDLVSGRLCINYLDGNNRGYISIQNDNKMFCYDKVGGTEIDSRTSNFQLRDVNGWYHYVQSVNNLAGGSGGSLSDRFKTYLNGVDVSEYWTMGTSMGYNVNLGMQVVSGTNGFKIGSQEGGTDNWNGSMSYVVFVDGLQLPASDFGSVDSVTGEWKINTSPTVSNYGNNGFLILKNSNSLTDQSGKGNNFSLGGGTLTNTEDCPDNVFATMNSLANFAGQWALFENQNTYVRSAGSGEAFIASTLGIPATSGKFYTEVKYTAGGSESNIGLSSTSFPTSSTDFVGKALNSYSYSQNGEKRFNNNSSSYGNSYAPGDIIGIAVDATNSKLYFSKNGVFQNSGDPTSGATGTGAISISATPTEGFYYMACSKESGSTKNFYAWNFGNGYFQTSAVSSAGTAGSTPGIFEYDVPTNYQPLSTKGLNA